MMNFYETGVSVYAKNAIELAWSSLNESIWSEFATLAARFLHLFCVNFQGPRLFLTCPMDSVTSQTWFGDLWNYSIIPYLLEAVREGVQVRNLRLK